MGLEDAVDVSGAEPAGWLLSGVDPFMHSSPALALLPVRIRFIRRYNFKCSLNLLMSVNRSWSPFGWTDMEMSSQNSGQVFVT